MTKIERIYDACDDFGLITSAEAATLGASRAETVQLASRGRLERVARGVYRIPNWPYQEELPYAVAVKAAGDGAFLFGESVVALLGLASTDPGRIWVATARRTRRDLGPSVRLVRACGTTPVTLLGVPCQPVAEALESAVATMGRERAQAAARRALHEGYVTAYPTMPMPSS